MGIPEDPAVITEGFPRQTEPFGFPSRPAPGGENLIPKRTSLRLADMTGRKLADMADSDPARLLTLLRHIHPGVSKAHWDVQMQAIGPEGLSIVAVRVDESGNETKDEAGTRAIQELWDSQPCELGGLAGIQSTLLTTTLFTGMAAAEGVPGPLLRGVYRVWPVDPLTLVFGRDSKDSDITPYQRQSVVLQGGAIKASPNKRLNKETFFWRALHNWVDEPEGASPYQTVTREVIADLALIQDLRDAVHNGAWPRYVVGFNFKETYEIAVKVMGITDPEEAGQWVHNRFKALVNALKKMPADQNFVVDTAGSVQALAAGNFAGIEAILAFLRQRIFWALKELPSLMGEAAHSETYETVAFQVHTAGIETLRSVVLYPLVRIADLHLRLLGMRGLKAKAVYPRIRTSDALIDQQVEEYKIRNAAAKRDQRWQDQETSAIEVTGSGAVGEAPPAEWEIQRERAQIKSASNIAGQSRPEQDATRRARKQGTSDGK